MFQQIFVLLDQLLTSEVTIFIEQIGLEDLLSVAVVSTYKNASKQKGEQHSHCSKSNIVGNCVIVVAVESLI